MVIIDRRGFNTCAIDVAVVIGGAVVTGKDDNRIFEQTVAF